MNTVIIDIGNVGVKTGDGKYIPSKVQENSSIFYEKGYNVTINGKNYIVGTGDYETETIKSSKENFYPLLLTALAQSMDIGENAANLVVGLPLSQFTLCSKEIKAKLLEDYRQNVITVDGFKKDIIINDVLVVPEGVGALYGLPQEFHIDDNHVVNLDRTNIIIADIGGLTTNIFEMDNGSITKDLTLDNVGTLHMFTKLKFEIKHDYTDMKLTYDKLDKILSENTFSYFGNSIDATKYIKKLNPIMKTLYDTLKMNYSIEDTQLVLCGGGSKYVYPYILKKITNSLKCDDIFLNAKGFKVIGDNYFKKF